MLFTTQKRDTLGQVQTPYFTWAESNANEVEQRIFLICIRFGSCEVRLLNLALVTILLALMYEGTIWKTELFHREID